MPLDLEEAKKARNDLVSFRWTTPILIANYCRYVYLIVLWDVFLSWPDEAAIYAGE